MAENIDIISDKDLQAPLQLAQNYKKLANDYDAVVASMTLMVNKMESQDATMAELQAHTKQLEKETKKLEKTNKEAAKSSESLAVATELADNATGGFITRVKMLGKQLLTLLANPIVAFLSTIGVGLLAVASYFRNTNEGADKFEKILAVINGVIDYLTNKFAALGEQIVKLFDEGNVVGEAFLFVFNRLLNMVVGVIDTFTNLLKVANILSKYSLKDILLGRLKPADIKELDKAFVDLGKSVLSAITGIGQAADDIKAKTEALLSLTEAGQKLGDELRDRILSKAQAELQIEKLLFDAKDKTTKTDQQRLDALKQAVKLSEDQLKIDLDLATRKERQFTAELLHKKSIITSDKESNAILAQGTTLLQDQALERLADDKQLEERRKLQANVFNLQRNYFAETKKSIAQIGALQKEIDDEAIKRAELLVRARLKAFDEYIQKTKTATGAEILGVKSNIEQEKTLRKNFGDRLIDDAKERAKRLDEIEKERLEKLKEREEKRKFIAGTALQAIDMVGQEIFARRQDRLAAEAQQIEVQREAALKAAGDDERAKLAINRRFDREQAKIKTKQAQADKQAAIFGIIINTALGIVKAAPVIPLMIATGIIGAIQLALVASKPIPKFATGTDNAPDMFIAGERGREIVSRGGNSLLVDRPTMFTGMAGAKIFSNPNTEEILGDISDIGPAIAYGSRVKRIPTQYEARIADGLNENNKWLKKIANKNDVDFVVDEEGFHTYARKVARRNKRLNDRFYGR